MQQTLGQLQHQGEWRTLEWLRQNGGRVGDTGLAKLRRVDIQEGKPIILGNEIWVVFLYDRGRQTFFIEQTYQAETQPELFSAFKVLEEEWI